MMNGRGGRGGGRRPSEIKQFLGGRIRNDDYDDEGAGGRGDSHHRINTTTNYSKHHHSTSIDGCFNSSSNSSTAICQDGSSPDYPAYDGPNIISQAEQQQHSTTNRKLIKIGNGQIISLSELKVRKSGLIRKATFKCLSSQIRCDNFDNESCGGGDGDGECDDSGRSCSTPGNSSRSSSVLFKLVFSTKYITEEDMHYIYLGSTLVELVARSINKVYYVNSFRKIDLRRCQVSRVVSAANSSLVTASSNAGDDNRTDTSQESGAFAVPFAVPDAVPAAAADDNYQRDLYQRLPKDIRELYEYCSRSSPYSFLFSMAYVFANNITKSGSFFRLKLALMLSLISQTEQPKNNCSLLVVCDDDLVIGRHLQWAANLAKKHFLYSSWLHSLAGANSTAGSLSFSSSTTDMRMQLPNVVQFSTQAAVSQALTQPLGPFNHFVNSGTLNLAADGIHLFTNAVNLCALSAKERTFLEHALESNEIMPKELKATNVEISESKLKSIIWANISYSQNMGNSNNNNRAAGLANFLASANKTDSGTGKASASTKSRWTSLFGTVVTVPDAGLWLPDAQRTITLGDWQAYFELAADMNPVAVNAEAEAILRQYFMANRRHRPASQFQSKSLSILFGQSKAIAKLNLRKQVTRHDALLAILLYEQQLQQLYPHSMSPIVFSFRDITHIVEDSEEEEENKKKKRVEMGTTETTTSGQAEQSQSQPNRQQHYQNMSSLLDDSYMGSFERTLMDLFANKVQHNQQPPSSSSSSTPSSSPSVASTSRMQDSISSRTSSSNITNSRISSKNNNNNAGGNNNNQNDDNLQVRYRSWNNNTNTNQNNNSRTTYSSTNNSNQYSANKYNNSRNHFYGNNQKNNNLAESGEEEETNNPSQQ